MADNKKKLIKYTSRDFNSIKKDLVDYAKRYYANTNKDFSEASFGSMVLDTVSYVGDILNFYLDYSVNESFLDTSVEYDNIIRHGRALGYKFQSNPSSYGIATFYVIVPAKSVGLGPDSDYIPLLQRGTEIASVTGNLFILNENVDFSDDNNEVVVSGVDSDTGLPTSYAIKAHGQVISGELLVETVTIGNYERFLKVPLESENITEIVSVLDSEGHEYYEVPYLSENVIYKSIINRSTDKDVAREILKPVVVARRFVVERERDITYLQFGYGSEDEIKTNSIADPTNVILNIHGKSYTTDTTFDPSKLIATDKFGVVPSNTKLRIVYRSNNTENVNASTDSLTEVIDPLFQFDNIISLNPTKVSVIINSLEVTNEEPIVGDVSLPSSTELRRRIYDNFATQNRAVTLQDYKAVVYAMPPQFGAVKRVNVVQDHDSFKRNLNLYCVSEDQTGVLTTTSNTIKENMKAWLNQKKVINDTIDILNTKVVNLGLEIEIIVSEEENKFAVLSAATDYLASFYQEPPEIGEPFLITQVYQILKNIDEVLDVASVKVVNKNGGNYSDTRFNINKALTADGRMVVVDEDMIWEIKFPKLDVRISVR